jgi:hypothetical protein
MPKTDDQDWLMSQLEAIAKAKADEPQAERRRKLAPGPRMVRSELNEAQLDALANLEKYGWELKFVRHPASGRVIPYVFDSDRKRFAVLKPDGTVDEKTLLDIRKA